MNKKQFINDFSIVICTFNPEEKIFLRTLNAIESFIIPEELKIECVIVDNNSTVPVNKLPYVQSFLKRVPWAKVIQEKKQGLTFARLTGAKATNSSFIIFIDDDNEPARNYIEAAKRNLENYQCIAALGPGKIHVEFIGSVSGWFDKNFRACFQERDCKHIEYGRIMSKWMNFYPFGTGLIVRRDVIEQYCQAIEDGRLASLDRRGSSLSSAGDIQIVWEAIKMGYAAGIAPNLQVNHLISKTKTNLGYIKRLTFGTASSYYPALIESFPEELDNVCPSTVSNQAILSKALKITLRDIIKFQQNLLPIHLAQFLGGVTGMIRVLNSDKHKWVDKVAELLNFC